MNPQNSTRAALAPFIFLIIFAAVAVYAVNVFNTGNWQWYKAEVIVPRPSRIVIVDHGQRTTLAPGYSGFPQLADAITESITHVNNNDLIPIGLSRMTLADYSEKALVMEVYFDQPLRFNTTFRGGEPTQILIPLKGSHAGSGYFFRGAQGEWWYGALRMVDATPLLALLSEMGFVVDGYRPTS
jgi:hypothetical protein